MCMVCVCVCVCERERERERRVGEEREGTEKEVRLEQFKMQYGHYGHMTRNTCDYDHFHTVQVAGIPVTHHPKVK